MGVSRIGFNTNIHNGLKLEGHPKSQTEFYDFHLGGYPNSI